MIRFLLRLGAGYSPRTRRLLGTAAASYGARFGAAATLIITIPLANATMAPDRFGVWMMLGAMLGFFAFADLGIGNGVLNRVSEAAHRQQPEEASRIMRAGYACTFAASLLLCTAWGLWVALADDPLAFAGSVAEPLRTEALRGFTAFVLLLALNLPLQLVQKFQLAYQDGHWVGVSQLACSLASLAALPIALWNRADLATLMFCTLGLQAAVNAVSTLWWFARSGLAPQLAEARVERHTLAPLLRTGGLFFALQLSAAFAFQSDAFVITQLLGPAAYGEFAAIQRIFLSMSTLVGAALVGLWPAFGHALTSGDVAWARKAYFRALLIGVGSMGGLSVLVTLGMPWIASDWLRAAVPPPLALPLVLSVWAVLETAGQVTGSLLNGAGMVRVQVVVAVAMAATSFGVKWLLVPVLGAWGAVVATIAAYSLISVPVQIWLLASLLGRSR